MNLSQIPTTELWRRKYNEPRDDAVIEELKRRAVEEAELRNPGCRLTEFFHPSGMVDADDASEMESATLIREREDLNNHVELGMPFHS